MIEVSFEVNAYYLGFREQSFSFGEARGGVDNNYFA
eukprot:CAMPEP_0114577622 /NCGR_PEP_ID=MMETSP0125-20121206/2261_1 /TAXON_ID=485358 ORGANISM="Aristerostoma sp., Strain ATCC 50986" /NCGR_SAMPLE_ID=MMETSP0125 /ASSEMBLY_ACC=CAM_ASM_000245 /LENGTH=35 /DNA_ID= /DNA_START= /DNA_END= /DNA_ORIENTATION=